MADAAPTGKRKARRRANGEGSLFYVKSEDRWRGAIAWLDDDGKQLRRSVAGKTQAEVRSKLAAVKAAVVQGETTSTATTVGEYLPHWLERERSRVRPATWRVREHHVRLYLLPALGRIRLDRLTPTDVERTTSGLLARGLAPRTAASVRISLRRALVDAQRDGLVFRNVAALARPPRIIATEAEHLDSGQVRQLLTAVMNDKQIGPLVRLAVLTGMRQGELLGLPWSAVHLDGRTLQVRQALALNASGGYSLAEPKTSRSRRTIHLPDAAVSALRDQGEAQQASETATGDDWQNVLGLVFTDEVGRPWRGTVVTRLFKRMLVKAGLPEIPFHGLRHSAATAMLAGGVPLEVVSRTLGHSTISITGTTYSHAVPDQQRAAAAVMDRMLSDAP